MNDFDYDCMQKKRTARGAFAHISRKRGGGRALIVLPLGVRQEFARDAETILGYPAPVYITKMQDLAGTDAEIVMTNYERVRDGDIDPTQFTAVALDEASVLRSFGSKTYQTFLPKFRGVKYKLVCTATPSPNRHKELIHYAGYLEIMDTGNALTRFFSATAPRQTTLPCTRTKKMSSGSGYPRGRCSWGSPPI